LVNKAMKSSLKWKLWVLLEQRLTEPCARHTSTPTELLIICWMVFRRAFKPSKDRLPQRAPTQKVVLEERVKELVPALKLQVHLLPQVEHLELPIPTSQWTSLKQLLKPVDEAELLAVKVEAQVQVQVQE
jgi:hypothetical protein